MDALIDFKYGTYLAKGKDSIVYLSEDELSVIKVYDKLINNLRINTLENCLNVIQTYANDTLLAAKIIESNWKNVPKEVRKINYEGKKYDLSIKIIPQGKAQILNNSVVSIGQKYLSCDSLAHYFVDSGHPELMAKLINANEDEIDEGILYSSKLINRNVLPSFSIVFVNIKPILNESEQKLDLIVTDLANNLIRNYLISAKEGYLY